MNVTVTPEVATDLLLLLKLVALAFHAYVVTLVGGGVITRAALVSTTLNPQGNTGLEEVVNFVYLLLQLLFCGVYAVMGLVIIYRM